MRNNIIWVDFTAKTKNKNKPKGFLTRIIYFIKSKLKPSGRLHQNPKLLDDNHKSIL